LYPKWDISGYNSGGLFMARTAQIRARADAQTKKQAEAILAKLGLTPSAAINLFYRQIIMRRALPFSVDMPNAETRAAIEEARSGKGSSKPSLSPICSRSC
jgi:DNA-damage-inducible protein J